MNIREAGLLRVCGRREDIGSGELAAACLRVGRVTVGAADVVAPVFTAAEVIVLFLTRVTGQTRLGDLFRRLVFERDDLLGIAFFAVCFAWSMARLATGNLVFPTADLDEFRV